MTAKIKTTRKDKLISDPHQFAAIVPPLHALSGNSLIFISCSPDPSGCKLEKWTYRKKKKKGEGRASDFDFIQLYFFTVTYTRNAEI